MNVITTGPTYICIIHAFTCYDHRHGVQPEKIRKGAGNNLGDNIINS